jgi:cobalt/nickel transport system permease protein
MKNGITNKKIFISSIIGCVIALQLGAFSVTLETSLSNITELPFKMFLTTMLPIHLAIGLVEGLITQAVLIFINNTRPELLKLNTNLNNKFSFKKAAVVLVSTTIIIASGLSLAASSLPDGLEYSVQAIANTEELNNPEDDIYYTSSKIQETTSILPDYQNTSLSGIVGVGIILTLSAVGSFVIKKKGLVKTSE